MWACFFAFAYSANIHYHQVPKSTKKHKTHNKIIQKNRNHDDVHLMNSSQVNFCTSFDFFGRRNFDSILIRAISIARSKLSFSISKHVGLCMVEEFWMVEVGIGSCSMVFFWIFKLGCMVVLHVEYVVREIGLKREVEVEH